MTSTTPASTSIPESLETTFLSAFWIWTPEADVITPEAGDRAFRNTYTTPTGKNATSALILIAVDNGFSLYVNGQLIGASPDGLDTWKMAQMFNVAPLDPRSNLFAIRATNLPNRGTGSLLDPAGVLCAIQVVFSDGTATAFPSDGTWKSIGVIPTNFESLSTDESMWEKAISIAQYGSGIWGAQVDLPMAVPQQTTISLPSTTSSTISVSISVGPTSATSIASPSSSFTSPQNSKVTPDIGTIVGGASGGIAILILVVTITIILKRRKNIRINKEVTGGVIALQKLRGGAGIVTPFPFRPMTLPQVRMDTETSESGSHWVKGLVAGVGPAYQYRALNDEAITHHGGGRCVITGGQEDVPPVYQASLGLR